MCTAMVAGYDEPEEDHSVSSAVDAMLLWVTPAKIFPGWFDQMLDGKGSRSEFDPDKLLRPDLPPMVFFQGTADDTVPAWSVEAFVKKSQEIGNHCDLHMYEGQTHLGWGENAEDVLQKMAAFLESIGFISGKN
jgi:acetyl esterase/lipase